MRWKISSLDDSFRRELVAVGAEQRLDDGPCCLLHKRRLRALLVCSVIGVMLTALCLFVSMEVLDGRSPVALEALAVGLSGLAGIWTLLLLVESVRAAASKIKPFIFITPRYLLDSGADHDYLTGYRLRDATDFQTTDTYSGSDFRGRRFSFKFPEGNWSVTLKDAASIRRLEQVLERARVNGETEAGGVDLLPTEPGIVGRATRPFTNPFGEVWLGIGGVLILCVLVGVIASDVYRRYVART